MAFQRSLSAMGTMTSLNSGFPKRETCTHGPADLAWRSRPARMVAFWRLAAPQIPGTAPAAIGAVGTAPARVRGDTGAWMAMLGALGGLRGATPRAVGRGIRGRQSNGRR